MNPRDAWGGLAYQPGYVRTVTRVQTRRIDMSSDAQLPDLRMALASWYRSVVKEYAEQIQKESRDERRELDEVLHETLDGCQEVIYTSNAQLVIAASNSDSACEDETGEKAETDEARAYWALRVGVLDYIDHNPLELQEDE